MNHIDNAETRFYFTTSSVLPRRHHFHSVVPVGQCSRPQVLLRMHAGEQRDHITRGIFEHPKPTGVGNFRFRIRDGRTERNGLLQIGFDIIAVDIDHNVARLNLVAEWTKATARTFVRFPHGVVHLFIVRDVPAEKFFIKPA